MRDRTEQPDLGRHHGRVPDRGSASGHTPADHAEPRRTLTTRRGPNHSDPSEKARPRDTHRSGA